MKHLLNLASGTLIACLLHGSLAFAEIVHSDDFEYVVSRDQSGAREVFVNQGGWTYSKTQQDDADRHAYGYIYTTDSIPGYSGSFPGNGSNRVLAIEARGGTLGGQTDFYLQFGSDSSPDNTIPGDVWFQFWVYPQYYGNQLSRWREEDKFLYVCSAPYPCHSHKWMLYHGAGSYNPNMGVDPLGNPSHGEFFWHLRESAGVSNIEYTAIDDLSGREYLGHTNLTEYMVRNRWTLVKMRFNTTTTSGSWEAWVRPMGGQWIKVAEWIDGVTPNFLWRIPEEHVGGHRVLRMPTTIGGVSRSWYDSWLYMDDFVIASSEADLPVYADEATVSSPMSPTNVDLRVQ